MIYSTYQSRIALVALFDPFLAESYCLFPGGGLKQVLKLLVNATIPLELWSDHA